MALVKCSECGEEENLSRVAVLAVSHPLRALRTRMGPRHGNCRASETDADRREEAREDQDDRPDRLESACDRHSREPWQAKEVRETQELVSLRAGH